MINPDGRVTVRNPRRLPLFIRGFQLETVIVRCPPLATAGFALMATIHLRVLVHEGSPPSIDPYQFVELKLSGSLQVERLPSGEMRSTCAGATSTCCTFVPL